MNLVFLDAIVDAPREIPDELEESELPGIRAALLEHVRAHHPVTIDGVVVEPTATPLVRNDPDPALLPLFPVSGMRGLRKVQMTLHYAAAAAPDRVAFVWQSYPPDILTGGDPPPPLFIEAELTADGRRQLVPFTVDEPEYIWHRPAGGSAFTMPAVPLPGHSSPHYRLPLLALLIIGAGSFIVAVIARRARWLPWVAVPALLAAGIAVRHTWTTTLAPPATDLPSAAQATEVFAALHRQIYRAFDYVEDERIYDELARAVDGALLDALYRQVYTSLVMQDEGGAVSQVTDLTPIDTAVEAIGPVTIDGTLRAGFVVQCHWQLVGSVYHWGHSHERTSVYRARYRVIATDDGWRIGAVDVLEQYHLAPDDALPVDDSEFEL